jgi:hypothetical protein
VPKSPKGSIPSSKQNILSIDMSLPDEEEEEEEETIRNNALQETNTGSTERALRIGFQPARKGLSGHSFLGWGRGRRKVMWWVKQV